MVWCLHTTDSFLFNTVFQVWNLKRKINIVVFQSSFLSINSKSTPSFLPSFLPSTLSFLHQSLMARSFTYSFICWIEYVFHVILFTFVIIFLMKKSSKTNEIISFALPSVMLKALVSDTPLLFQHVVAHELRPVFQIPGWSLTRGSTVLENKSGEKTWWTWANLVKRKYSSHETVPGKLY